MYPGDSSAPGYLVYNCHCTQVAMLDDVDTSGGMRRARDPVTGESVLVKDMTYAEWAGWKDKSGKTALNDLNGLAKPVTLKAIERVKALPSSILDDAGQKKLQQAHKDLLQEVMNRGGMVEVARCYDMNMEPLSGYVSKNDKGQVKIPRFDVPYIASHNHPSGLTFSVGDLYGFAKNNELKILTVVGNNGAAYSLEKTDKIDKSQLLLDLTLLQERIDLESDNLKKVNLLVSFINKGKEYGFIYER